MNNLQPYEKHLANRLQQVPVPDKEQGWEEMRKLLDRDLPEGSSGWSGNRKWWWMGITVAIIIAGLWMNQEFNHKKAAANQALANSTSVSKDRNNEIKRRDDLKNSINQPNKNNTTNETASTSSETVANKNEVAQPANKKDDEKGISTHPLNANENSITKRISSIGASGNNRSDVHANAEKINHLKKVTAQSANVSDENPISKQKSSGQQVSSTEMSESIGTKEVNASVVMFVDRDASHFLNPAESLSGFPSTIAPMKAEPGKTDKAFAKEMRKKSIKEDKRKMSAGSMRGLNSEKDHDLTFAAGLAMPQSFAIGSQQSPAYGINGKSSRVSDYLPVPFFQYHLDSRLFLQTELQFQSPQYTDRLLVYQNQQQIGTTNNILQKNIFIEKLYYFHIPFNVYYSPIRNVYVGTGLQFSSLLSGVATYQDNHYTGGTLQNSYSRVQGFKDDSVASRLSASEWRYQVDANYYFRRFTFGARYNQALNQFVNLQPSPGMPYTQGRNQSFFIYLRYNIFEERKKGGYYANAW